MFLGKASETCTNVYFSSEQFFPDYNLRTLFSEKNKSLIKNTFIREKYDKNSYVGYRTDSVSGLFPY